MDGNLQVAFNVNVNFVTSWNQTFVDNDFVNPNTGVIDPKYLFGSSNFDVFCRMERKRVSWLPS